MDTRKRRRRRDPQADPVPDPVPDLAPERECSANCMQEEYANSPMYPCCGTGNHFVHLECLNRLFETTDEPCCPVCRDPFLKIVKDLCVKTPYVAESDADDEAESEESYEEESASSEGSMCPFHASQHEVTHLRRLIRDLSAQFVYDYDRSTRTRPPRLSPVILRRQDDP